MQTEPTPTPQFIKAIAAAVEYWRRRTEELDDTAIARLDEERQNLYRAVEFGLKRPETWEAVAEVALQAFDLVERRGYWREWMPMLKAAVTQCGGAQQGLKCRLLNRLGVLYRLDRQLDVAIAMHREVEVLAREAGNKQELAEALFYLGGDHVEIRDFAQAERYTLAALTVFDELEDVGHWLAWSYMVLGTIARRRGEGDTAEAHMREAVARWRMLNRTAPLARTLSDLGNALWPAGKVAKAEACLVEAAELVAPTTYELDKTLTQLNLGTFYYHQQQWGKAEMAFRRADSPFLRQSGHVYYQAITANNLGNVLLERGRPVEAESYLRRALELWHHADDDVQRANTLGTLGQALVAQGQAISAIVLYNQAIELLQRYPDDAWANRTLEKFTLARRMLESGPFDIPFEDSGLRQGKD